ncbi:MAG TPA: DMT family transporter [Kofleriaceae bacterium]|nr:DMT family transporter [Kofleriaceae bacterium]
MPDRPLAPISGGNRRALPMVAASVTVLAWASAFVVIRAVGRDLHPGALTLGRLLIGVTALGGLVARAGWIRPTRREWLLVIGCGVAWFALYNLALNAAERRLDAGTTAMLVNVGPLFVAVLAGLFLGEGLPRWLLGGALVSLVGVAVIARASAATGPIDRIGVLLCLAAAAAYAVGVVLQKVALRRLPALQVTWLACASAAVVCLPFAAQLRADLAAAPVASALGVVYLGAVPTALAFTTWAYALARTEAGRLGAITYAAPPAAILIAWMLLGETPQTGQLVGGAICLAGVAVSRIRR